MEVTYSEQKKQIVLPSAFQPGDQVILDFGVAGIITGCEIFAVRFTDIGKVRYDVYIPVVNGIEDEGYTTLIDSVDSCLVRLV